MIDGRKSAGDLAGILKQDGIIELVSVLAGNGFISPAASAQPASTRTVETTSTQNDEGLQEAKDFMITVAHSCLGLLAADLVKRIESANAISQLIPVVGYWMAALRDSKFGSHLSERYLVQLKKALPELQEN